MRSILFFLLAIIVLCFALFGCKNNFTNGINQVEITDPTQSEDLVVEHNYIAQDDESIANVDDSSRNEPDDRPIDLAHLERLVSGGYIEVKWSRRYGIITDIQGDFTSVKVAGKNEALVVFNQLASFFNFSIQSIDDIEVNSRADGAIALYRVTVPMDEIYDEINDRIYDKILYNIDVDVASGLVKDFWVDYI